jgi:hypothetical protein
MNALAVEFIEPRTPISEEEALRRAAEFFYILIELKMEQDEEERLKNLKKVV